MMARELFLVCDNIRSLENIGSMFRTADGLGVSKIYLCGISGRPPHPKISKTALGAERTVLSEYYGQTWRLVGQLQKKGIQTVALEQTEKSVSLDKFAPHFPLALVVGNEVKGVSKSVLDRVDAALEIPMQGSKESFNVAVAFGIAAYRIKNAGVRSWSAG